MHQLSKGEKLAVILQEMITGLRWETVSVQFNSDFRCNVMKLNSGPLENDIECLIKRKVIS